MSDQRFTANRSYESIQKTFDEDNELIKDQNGEDLNVD